MLTALLCAAILLVAAAWTFYKRHDADWRPLLPGIVGTAVGIVVCIAAYRWLFDSAACTGRGDFACMLNQNQGVLTFLAALLTAVGLWGAALNRAADRRQERRRAERRATVAIQGALKEVSHNLIHIAGAYDGKTRELLGIPQLSVGETNHLCEHDFRGDVDSELIARAQNLERNYARIERDESREDVVNALQGFVNTSLRVLLEAAKHHPAAAAPVLSAPGFQDLRRLTGRRCFIAFCSSEAKDVAPSLRTNEAPVICWFNDAAPEGVVAFPQFTRFRDMAHPPH